MLEALENYLPPIELRPAGIIFLIFANIFATFLMLPSTFHHLPIEQLIKEHRWGEVESHLLRKFDWMDRGIACRLIDEQGSHLLKTMVKAIGKKPPEQQYSLLKIELEDVPKNQIYAPVHFASFCGDIEALQSLMELAPSGPGILEHQSIYGLTSAHRAACAGSVETLEFILRNAPSGIKILEILDDNGDGPLEMYDEIFSWNFTPKKLRKIGLQRELLLIKNNFSRKRPLVTLVLSIIDQQTELLESM